MSNRIPHQAVILLGSNLGNPRKQLQRSLALLGEKGHIAAISTIYRTAPWGESNQADFLNMVLLLETMLSPKALLLACQDIEKQLHKNKKTPWGERSIDVDILFYDDLVVDVSDLQIPHPRLHLRRFTLIPLVELIPLKKHPLLQKNMQELLAICPDGLAVHPESPIPVLTSKA